MITKRRLSSNTECHQLEHLSLMDELDSLMLAESCCQICHCDCYNSHRSTDQLIEDNTYNKFNRSNLLKNQAKDSNNNTHVNHKNVEKNTKNVGSKKKMKKRSEYSTQSLERRFLRKQNPSLTANTNKNSKLNRSKSASSLHSRQQPTVVNTSKSYFTRDCELLQSLLSSLETPRLEVKGNDTMLRETQLMRSSKSTLELPSTTSKSSIKYGNWSHPKICQSLANLCLAPSVREAYELVSEHDKKILNRMANKRSERVLDKENAWLARKFWENERYERELLRCEQTEEYKRAVRDKQCQDFILTKERLNELAHKDYQELQRLRSILAQKDALSKKRLEAKRVERDILLCQRRCEELKKSEAVNLHQEEQNLGDLLRKQQICSRLTHRLRRADEIRNEQLDGYLKRLKYDNLIEQLVHKEHWQEVQEQEKLKQTQLKQHIEAKSKGTQKFIEQRQHRMETLSKTAKISASLRELVRSSVTPEDPFALGQGHVNTVNIGKILLEPSSSKFTFKY